MPIYEYQCQACGHSLEKLQKISDAALKDCPACEKPELKKKVTAGAFRLSGGGWYETDFKTGNKKNLVGDSSSEGAKKSKASNSKNTSSNAKSNTTAANSSKTTSKAG